MCTNKKYIKVRVGETEREKKRVCFRRTAPRWGVQFILGTVKEFRGFQDTKNDHSYPEKDDGITTYTNTLEPVTEEA